MAPLEPENPNMQMVVTSLEHGTSLQMPDSDGNSLLDILCARLATLPFGGTDMLETLQVMQYAMTKTCHLTKQSYALWQTFYDRTFIDPEDVWDGNSTRHQSYIQQIQCLINDIQQKMQCACHFKLKCLAARAAARFHVPCCEISWPRLLRTSIYEHDYTGKLEGPSNC